MKLKTALTVAGSDCSGGAGIQADLKTFSANGVFGMSVITSVVAENTSRVISVQNISPEIITDQIDAVFEDIEVNAVKVGMLSDSVRINTVAAALKKYEVKYAVIDPVMIAKGGHALMQENSLSALVNKIIPLAYVLTPNIPEAQTITGIEISTVDDMKKAAEKIYSMGAKNVLVKGGHLSGEAIDLLFDGKDFEFYLCERINTKNTHGTGCTYSSAIAANLAKDIPIKSAVENAKDYVTNAIRYSLEIGKGHGPTNHFYKLYL